MATLTPNVPKQQQFTPVVGQAPPVAPAVPVTPVVGQAPPVAPAVPMQNSNPGTTIPTPTTTTSPSYNSPAFLEAAALLLLWSMCVIIEGGVRFNSTEPWINHGIRGIGGLSRRAVIAAALFEVMFGLLGLFLGTSALVFRWFNASVVKISMLVQALLSIVVFITFVIVVPSYAADTAGRGLEKGLEVIGIFTSMSFCLALQGGQFVFMARLIAAATGDDFLKSKSGNRLRAIFWNANMLWAGFFTLVMGSVLLAKDNVLIGPYVYPPHIGSAPGYTLVTGLVMLLWSAFGIVLSCFTTINFDRTFYYIGSAIVFLNSYLNFTIAQVGLVRVHPGLLSGAVAMHTGLIFFVSFLGPYFMYQSSKKDEEDL